MVDRHSDNDDDGHNCVCFSIITVLLMVDRHSDDDDDGHDRWFLSFLGFSCQCDADGYDEDDGHDRQLSMCCWRSTSVVLTVALFESFAGSSGWANAWMGD